MVSPGVAIRAGAESMEWHDAVAAFQAKGNGWISPKGEMLVFILHDHFAVLRDAGHFANEIDELDDMQPEAIRRGCEEAEALYGRHNAEWHTYDMADSLLSEARGSLLDKLYGAGWVRLGPFRQEYHASILVEGFRHGLENARTHLSDLSASAGLEVIGRVVSKGGPCTERAPMQFEPR
jgi:hypothetical protein